MWATCPVRSLTSRRRRSGPSSMERIYNNCCRGCSDPRLARKERARTLRLRSGQALGHPQDYFVKERRLPGPPALEFQVSRGKSPPRQRQAGWATHMEILLDTHGLGHPPDCWRLCRLAGMDGIYNNCCRGCSDPRLARKERARTLRLRSGQALGHPQNYFVKNGG